MELLPIFGLRMITNLAKQLFRKFVEETILQICYLLLILALKDVAII